MKKIDELIAEGGVKVINLPNDKYTIVDADEYIELSKYNWHISSGYACRNVYTKVPNSKTERKCLAMHRVINKTPEGLQTDHINCNKLDNRKKNLRSCTNKQNSMNKKSYKSKYSGFKGVSYDKNTNVWVSYISVDGKSIHLGRFKTEVGAAQAYNNIALELHGEFARLNEIDEILRGVE